MLKKGFQKGDPRAVEAGRKGDWYAGYQAGWKAKHREEAQARTDRARQPGQTEATRS